MASSLVTAIQLPESHLALQFSITPGTGSTFPNPGVTGPFYVSVQDPPVTSSPSSRTAPSEICLVYAVDGDTFTVQRQAQGSPERFIQIGDVVTLLNEDTTVPESSSITWIYIGTPTQVGGLVDAYGTALSSFISANPSPYNVTPWIPFENGWGPGSSLDAPPSFAVDADGFVILRGGFSGSTTDVAVFHLPTGFRPYYQLEYVCATGFGGDALVAVLPDGSVVLATE